SRTRASSRNPSSGAREHGHSGAAAQSTEALFPRTDDVGRLARLAWSRSPASQVVWLSLTAAMLIAVALLTHATGGTRYSYLHLMYIPVGVAAFRFGALGGVVSGVVAGVLIGPLVPLDTSTATAQSLSGWLFRAALFMLNGGVLGFAAQVLNRRLERAVLLRKRLGQVHARSLKTFARLAAERDEPTAGHCERVARNAVAIGRRLGVPSSDLSGLYWAGMLHDLGKIGVPELILHKPGRLTSEEFTVMKR